MKFTVVLSPEADGGYSVVCPAVPGCVSQGDSLDEALANVREAILLCLEVRNEQRLALPIETRSSSPRRSTPASRTERRKAYR